MAGKNGKKLLSDVPLAEVLRRRAKDTDYQTMPTRLPGVFMRVEKGHEPEGLTRYIGRLAMLGRRYVQRDKRLETLNVEQKDDGDKIKRLTKQHKGLFGIAFAKIGKQLAIYPAFSIVWHGPNLKKALGEVHSAFVQERVDVAVSVPLGHETERGPLTGEMVNQAINTGLMALGFSEDQVSSIVKSTVVPLVNETELSRMLDTGQLVLPENVAEITETWNIRPDEFRQV